MGTTEINDDHVRSVAETCRLKNGRLSYAALGRALGISPNKAKELAERADVPNRPPARRTYSRRHFVDTALSCMDANGKVRHWRLGRILGVSGNTAKKMGRRRGFAYV